MATASSLRRPLRSVSLVLGLLTAVFAAAVARAQGPDAEQSYLREMPPVARVLADMRDGDEMDSRARQMAAFERLLDIMKDLAGRRFSTGPYPNAAEKPIWDAYGAEIGRLRAEAVATFPAGPASINSPGSRWLASVERMRTSDALYLDLMQRYFTPETLARHAAATGAAAALSAAGRADIDRGLREARGEATNGTWENMTQEEQASAIAFGALMILLLLVAGARELLPFDVAGTTSGTPVLRFGLGRARLSWFTGVVANLRATDRTTITWYERISSTGTVLSRYSTSSTIRSEELDLVAPQGTHRVHTSHVQVGSPQGEFDSTVGQPLTAMWATRRWRKKGRYVLFRRPDIAADVPVANARGSLAGLLSPRGWSVLPAMLLGWTIGNSTDLLGGPMIGGLLRGAGIAFIAAIVWLVVYFAIDSRRRSRFDARELPKLRALVDGASA